MDETYARTNNICLVFLTMVAGTAALIYMRPVLIPLIFAIFVYSVLTPLVAWVQERLKIPKFVAVIASLFLFFLLLTATVLIFINSVESFVEGVPKYKQSVAVGLEFVEQQLAALNIFNINLELSKFTDMVQTMPLLSLAQRLGSQLLTFLGNLFLVFIFTAFMMTGGSRGSKKSKIVDEVLQKVSSYVGAKAFLSVLTGFLVYLILLIFGIELAFIFALLTVLLNFIPNIGSIVAVALPLPIVFLQYQFSWPFFVILTLTGAIQFSIGSVIEPKLMGSSMDLHPVTVLMCLIFWGMVWGIAGMFLAVPITAVLRIVFSKIEATHSFAEILAGRLPGKI